MNKNKFLKALVALFAVAVLGISCADKPTDPEGDKQQVVVNTLPEVIKNLGTKKVTTIDGSEISINFTTAKGSGNNYTVSVTAGKVEAIARATLSSVLSSSSIILENEKAKVTLEGNIVVTIDGGNKVLFVENSVPVSKLQAIINALGKVTIDDSKSKTFTFSADETVVSRVNAKEFVLNNGNVIKADATEQSLFNTYREHPVYKLVIALTRKVRDINNSLLTDIGSAKTKYQVCLIDSKQVDSKVLNNMEIVFNTTTEDKPTYLNHDLKIGFVVELGDTPFSTTY